MKTPIRFRTLVSGGLLLAAAGAGAYQWMASRIGTETPRTLPSLDSAAHGERVDIDIDVAVPPGADPLDPDSIAAAADRTIRVTRVAALISSLAIEYTDGRVYALPPSEVRHIDLGEHKRMIRLNAAPTGPIAALRFTVGLPKDLNHSDPAAYPAQHPLNPVFNNLHWSWAGGYVFLALEGTTTQVGAGKPTRSGFVYHLAGDDHSVAVRAVLKRDVAYSDATTGSTYRLTLNVPDLLASLLESSRAENLSATTHSRSGDPTVDRLKRALGPSFEFTAIRDPARLVLQPFARVPGEPTPSVCRTTTPHFLEVPDGFPAPWLPRDNPLTVQGIALGERLFRDTSLSDKNRIACSSCHQPSRGFVDSGRSHSAGVNGHATSRRTMPLLNLAWMSSYGWTGKNRSLRDQAIAPITDPREMGNTWSAVLHSINSKPAYRKAFSEAFCTDVVEPAHVAKALEQYLLTLVSANSRFDRALRGLAQLSEQEQAGLALFMSEHDPSRGIRGADCFHCHGGPLFTNNRFQNNGLDERFEDPGLASVTRRPEDEGKFKAPSLRDVAVRAPYMHDGRFRTLEEVIDHYSHGTRPSRTLDPNIAKHPNQAGLQLTAQEKEAVIAFLKTLTTPR